MNPAQRFDDLVREQVFQRLADIARDRSGASCFVLAAQTGICLPALTLVWAFAATALDGFSFSVAFLEALSVITARMFYRVAMAAERVFNARQALPKPAAPFFRLMQLALLACQLLVLVDNIANGSKQWIDTATFLPVSVALTSFYYFMICRPRPPQRRESRVPTRAAMAGAS